MSLLLLVDGKWPCCRCCSCWIWGCIIFIRFEEEGLNNLFKSKPLPPAIIPPPPCCCCFGLPDEAIIKQQFDNIIYSDWKQSIRRKKEIRKRLTESRNFWIRSSLNFFSNQIKTFLHLFSLSVLSSQTRVPFFLPRPWLSLSRTLYFHFRLILFGYQSSTPPVVSGHGPFAWDMSATSPAFLGPRAEAGQKSSIELKRG